MDKKTQVWDCSSQGPLYYWCTMRNIKRRPEEKERMAQNGLVHKEAVVWAERTPKPGKKKRASSDEAGEIIC